MPPPARGLETPAGPSSLPDEHEMRLRARWLAGLAADERESLPDLPIREVERRFASWLDEELRSGDDAGG